jgi:MFS family permease
VLAGAFTAMAALLALLAFMVYQTIFGVGLAYYVAFMLTSLASLAGCLLSPRTRGRAVRSWFSAGAVAAATGPLVSALAGHLGWGHPLLFTVISGCGWAVCATCNGVAGVIVIRSARRARHPDPRPLR